MASCMMVDNDNALVDVYIDPEHRDHPVSGQIIEECSLFAGRRNTGITINMSRAAQICTPTKQACPAFAIDIYEGKLSNVIMKNLVNEIKCDFLNGIDGNSQLQLQRISSYDAGVYGNPRYSFIEKYLLSESVTTAIATCDGTRITDGIFGYGCMQQLGRDSYLLGPLFGESTEIAMTLTNFLLQTLKAGQRVVIPTLSTNSEYQDILSGIGLTKSEKLLRVYNNHVPSSDFSRAYVMTTPFHTLL